MPSPRAPDPVQNARLHLLFRQALTASVTALIGAAVCAAVFWHAIRSPEPWIWLSGVGLATTLRFLLYRRFFRSGLRQRAESHWLRQHAWTAILIGVSWGPCLCCRPARQPTICTGFRRLSRHSC